MTYNNIKVHKKPEFHSVFRRYNFRKTTGWIKLIHSPAVLALMLRLQLRDFSFYIYYNVMITKKKKFNSSNELVYYAAVMIKIRSFILELRILRHGHPDKKDQVTVATMFTTPW